MTLGTVTKAAAMVVIGALGVARGEEEKVALGKLPATVKAAIKARFPGAELKGASKESAEGETLFEVSLTYKGDKYDVAVELSGEIEEIERSILVDALPGAVLKTIKSKYPKMKIKAAEQVTDEDGEVSYEVSVAEKGEEAVEVALTAEGKIKKGEAEEEDDEKAEVGEKKGEKHGEKAEKHEKEDEDEKHEKKAKKSEKKADKDDDDGEKSEKKAEKHEKKADKDDDE